MFHHKKRKIQIYKVCTEQKMLRSYRGSREPDDWSLMLHI